MYHSERIQRPGMRWRGTLADIGSGRIPISGVYILAYMRTIVYVGRANEVEARMVNHMRPAAGKLLVDQWLQTVAAADMVNVRMDVLEPPAEADDAWMRTTEEACIRQFRPLLNVALEQKAHTHGGSMETLAIPVGCDYCGLRQDQSGS